MASFPTNSMNIQGDTDTNTPSPSTRVGSNAAIVFKPTFADIKSKGTVFACSRQPFAIRRYLSERKRPLGYKRPLGVSVARERMHAKLQEFEARFNSAQTYDQFCEPASHSAVPYHHADVLDIVSPWMYPYYESDELSGIMARAQI
ncbi:hypothetical protein V8C26DRAFT_401329 [Trichoderma gracile]